MAGVSHRSPLAPWKTLIRAIAGLYQGQDENCRRFLAALEGDSVPGRAAGVLRSVLDESEEESLTPAGRRLVERIVGQRIELRAVLRALDEAFSRNDEHEAYRQIRRAVELCQIVCPERLVRLRQHISVKSAVPNWPIPSVTRAMGGSAVHDAYFLRLFARTIENNGGFAAACEVWDRFRHAAIKERIFAADGPENAFLYLHMAEVLRRLGPDHLWDEQQDWLDQVDEWADWGDEEPDSFGPSRRPARPKRDTYFLFPEQLYERAVALRPDAEIYKQWLDFVESANRADLKPDPIAQKWAAAFPQDSRPLLYLAEAAEKRNAFDKALKYVEQAEQLGGIDPKVRQARFRLLAAKAVRHLKQHKPDLAAKDLLQLEQLPQAAEKDRPAFLLALGWVHAAMQGEREQAARRREEMRALLGGPVSAAILLLSTARECQHVSVETEDVRRWLTAYQEKDLVGAVVRACQIGKDVDIETLLPGTWGRMLAKWFKRSDCDLDSADLLIMAEAALTADWPEVAYYCCGYGLQKGGPLQARLLFLRGKTLPFSQEDRRRECFAAALELARPVHDMDLVGEIADAGRQTLGPFGGFGPFGPDMMDPGNLSMDDETLKKVTEFERHTRKYPKGVRLPFFGGGPTRQCQCPSCRRARGELPRQKQSPKPRRSPNEPYLFDDIFEDEELDDEIISAGSEAEALDRAKNELSKETGVPPDVVGLMAEVARLNGGRFPQKRKDFERILERHPELLRKFQEAMLESLGREAFGPFDELEDDEFPDIDYEPPSTPFWPPANPEAERRRNADDRRMK